MKEYGKRYLQPAAEWFGFEFPDRTVKASPLLAPLSRLPHACRTMPKPIILRTFPSKTCSRYLFTDRNHLGCKALRDYSVVIGVLSGSQACEDIRATPPDLLNP